LTKANDVIKGNGMLLTHKTVPPGGWLYNQQDVSGGTIKRFRCMSAFMVAVEEILKFRKENRLPGATTTECANDLDAATCSRLGGDVRYCLKKKS
jgi:hypothetical protein